MRYCLDTSIIVDIFRGNVNISNKLDKIKTSNIVYITHITICELFKGAFLHPKFKEKVRQVRDFFSYFDEIGLDIESCNEFGVLFQKLKKQGKLIPEFDMMIASIAKTNNLILITKDKKHFGDIGIKVEEW